MRNSKLSFGLSGGLNLVKSYFSRLEVNETDDGLIMNDSPLGVMPDFSFGMHYYNEKFYDGEGRLFLFHYFCCWHCTGLINKSENLV